MMGGARPQPYRGESPYQATMELNHDHGVQIRGQAELDHGHEGEELGAAMAGGARCGHRVRS
jgi:hypothetical protein